MVVVPIWQVLLVVCWRGLFFFKGSLRWWWIIGFRRISYWRISERWRFCRLDLHIIGNTFAEYYDFINLVVHQRLRIEYKNKLLIILSILSINKSYISSQDRLHPTPQDLLPLLILKLIRFYHIYRVIHISQISPHPLNIKNMLLTLSSWSLDNLPINKICDILLMIGLLIC